MPRKCLICTHPKREEIDSALIEGLPLRDIGRRYSIHRSSLFRHKQNHLSTTLIQAKEADEITRSENLLEQIKGLRLQAHRIAKKAESKGDYRTALVGVRELTRIVELIAKLQGDLGEQNVNVIFNNQWVELRTTILTALNDYPEAKLKLAEALADAQ